MATHAGARYAGPAWLAVGLVVYVARPQGRGEGLLEHVEAPPTSIAAARAEFTSILVPMKLGKIGEEMVATAVKLAQERGAHVEALHVIRVPLDLPLDAELDEQEERAAASLAEATALGADHGVEVRGRDDPRPLDRRRRSSSEASAARRRPDRPRLVAALAAPVALLLADGRLRAAQGAVRGAHRRVPARASMEEDGIDSRQ